MDLRRNHTNLWLAIAFVLTWNSGFIGAENGLPYAGPFTILFWRYLALTGLLLLYLLVRGRWSWPGWKPAGHAALVGVLSHGVWLACVLLALDVRVAAGIVALVVALQPMTTGAFSGLVTGEHTSTRQWVGLVLGFLGVAVVIVARLNVENGVPAYGYLLPFGSVVAITGASLIQRRREIEPKTQPQPLDQQLFFQVLATTVAAAGPAILVEDLAADWNLEFFGTMVWLTLVVSLAAYALMWKLLERMDATRVAGLFYLGPPVTMLMAWVSFSDTPRWSDLLGLVVVAVGVLLVQWPAKKGRSQSE